MTLAELQRAAELLPHGASLTLPREALLEALANGNAVPTAQVGSQEPARLLTAKAVADRLGTSVRWVYHHQAQLGGQSLTQRCLRFPEAAVRGYLERRR